MGCLNPDRFTHWFGNIHLSGPCNRSCFFCIGQHMMALDSINNLGRHPLQGIDEFLEACHQRGVTQINLTGSNTDPLLYKRTADLKVYIRQFIPKLVFGIRTNGALARVRADDLALFDSVSLSVTSLDPATYRATMGEGEPPDIEAIARICAGKRLKGNIVLCPRVGRFDIYDTVCALSRAGFKDVNLREPYGQPHVGDPFNDIPPIGRVHGMPVRELGGARVVYWDVHWVEVESVNLYANGRVSLDYAITKGHDESGTIERQSDFTHAGRVREQWVKQ